VRKARKNESSRTPQSESNPSQGQNSKNESGTTSGPGPYKTLREAGDAIGVMANEAIQARVKGAVAAEKALGRIPTQAECNRFTDPENRYP
jgi:hypothetical protein